MLYSYVSYRAIRRALERDQRRKQPCRVPMWRLLLDEIVLMARRIGASRVAAVALVAFVCILLVEVALSSATPGPALAEPWRWLVAAVLTAVSVPVWAVVHGVRSAKRAEARRAER